MFKLFVFFYVLKHPVAADVILVSSCDTEKSTMVTDYSTAELWNVILKVNQIFRLLMRCDIVKMNVFVAPFEVMDDAFVGELLLDDKYCLEEVNNPFLYVKVIKLCNHRLLILQVSLILINKCISFINNVSDVVKYSTVGASVKST